MGCTGTGAAIVGAASDIGAFCIELCIIKLGAVFESNIGDMSVISSSLSARCFVLVSSSNMALSFLTRITNPLALIICKRRTNVTKNEN